MVDFNILLQKAIAAAIQAGKEILSVYNIAPEIELKADKSPLTIADKKSHQKIATMLEPIGFPVLSEEGVAIPYPERKNMERYWLVDPLDGTKEFIKHNGEFTVNIALIENQKSVLGVIYLPVNDTIYFGSVSLPSMMMHNVTKFFHTHQSENFIDLFLASAIRLPITTPGRPYTVVASRSHQSPETASFVSELQKNHGELAFISKGSSIKICLVAEGVADVYPRLAPTMEWDTAAGQAIAENAGCTMINYHTGTPVIYNKENLLNPFFVVMRP